MSDKNIDPFSQFDIQSDPQSDNSNSTSPNQPSSNPHLNEFISSLAPSTSTSNTSNISNTSNASFDMDDLFNTTSSKPLTPIPPITSTIPIIPQPNSQNLNAQNIQNLNQTHPNFQPINQPPLKPCPYALLLSQSTTLNLFNFLTRGCVFWKAGTHGQPHFLLFRLDPSLKYIQWYSRNKSLIRTRISLTSITTLFFGNNSKFTPYCNNRLIARSISIRSIDQGAFRPVSLSSPSPNNYSNNNHSNNNHSNNNHSNNNHSNNNHSNNNYSNKSKTVNKVNKGASEEIDFVSLSVIPFIIWKYGLGIACNYYGKLYNNYREINNIGELPIVDMNINIPGELMESVHLLYGFELYVARQEIKVRGNSKYERGVLGQYEVNVVEQIKQQEIHIRKGVEKILKRVGKSKKIGMEDRKWLLERARMIGKDMEEVMGMREWLGVARQKKIYWLAIAEIVALNEVAIAIGKTEKGKSSSKMF